MKKILKSLLKKSDKNNVVDFTAQMNNEIDKGDNMLAKSVFKMPKQVKIMGRTSSITNSFVNGIIPVIEPTEEQVMKVLDILGMRPENISCAYCGDKCTEWDHFRAIVNNKRPTGYISEINNLVPSCGKCNQSKGNSYWKEWMLSNASLSPKTRNVLNLDEKVKRLEAFEKWSKPIHVDFELVVGKLNWSKHWENCENIHKLMRESQILSDEIKDLINEAINSNYDNVIECFKNVNEEKVEVKNIELHSEKLSDQSKLSKYNLEDINNKKVGLIAREELTTILEKGIIPEEVVSYLQSKSYSKQIFDMNFSILVKIDYKKNSKEQRLAGTKVDRYYSKPIEIRGVKYYLTSQWFDRNKPYLIKFLMKYS